MEKHQVKVRDLYTAGLILSGIKTGFSALVAYRFSPLVREYQRIDKQRAELVRKYLEPGQNAVPDDKVADFNKEWDDLLNHPTEFSFNKVDISLFKDASLNPSQMAAISLFVCDTEAELKG